MPLSTIFQLLVAASFVGGGNRSTRDVNVGEKKQGILNDE
jgi:hypothetical protein